MPPDAISARIAARTWPRSAFDRLMPAAATIATSSSWIMLSQSTGTSVGGVGTDGSPPVK